MSETTEFGFSYEFAIDVNLGTAEAPNWQQIRFSSAIDPQTTLVSEDGATYDDNGSPHPVKLSESWTLAATIQQHRLTGGGFLPEVEKLLALAGPDAVGNAATGHFRWYDDPASHTPNPAEAYEGYGTVAMTRQNTGNAQIGGWNLTVTGQGRRTQIANPSTGGGALAPTISSVLPAGQGEDEQVTITGTGFSGATAVTFGGTDAVAFTVVNPTTIVASLPAGSAGAAAVIVEKSAQESAPFAYTRGA